jgi:methylenetetrahydrofolate--tRNA-(uracil-5-)-methyltransferase
MIRIIGGGLAGVEAAWHIANSGVPVTLYEMKPAAYSPAHKSPDLAELVCSNSFKAQRVESAAGLLKAEMRLLGSLCLEVADDCAVSAGGALAVDRAKFSASVTARISAHPRIKVRREEQAVLPGEGVTIVAAGPLAGEALSGDIRRLCGDALSFYDAAAPIVTAESVDAHQVFAASRYGNGEAGDYLNCPLNKEQYIAFHAALIGAERAYIHPFDVYEGCMPIEVLAARGLDAIRFGPMKPVGLTDPRTGHRPWATLQLRKENAVGTLYNLVGFQTNLTFGAQRRVFGLIPALAQAEYARFGVMHRNTFLDAPRVLNGAQMCKQQPGLFFAGQITGVEGYMESAANGITAAMQALRFLRGEKAAVFPVTTMIGALLRHTQDTTARNYQPMGANFGILPPLKAPVRDKKARYAALAERALHDLGEVIGKRVLAGDTLHKYQTEKGEAGFTNEDFA